jgi:hypothetical protein
MSAQNAYESLKRFLSLSAGRGGPIANTIDLFEKKFVGTSFPSEEERYKKFISLIVDDNALRLEAPLSNSIKTVFNNYPDRGFFEGLFSYNNKAYNHATQVFNNAASVASKVANLNEGPVDQIAANTARIVDQSQKSAMGASGGAPAPTVQPSPSPSPSPSPGGGVPAAMPDGTAGSASPASGAATPAPTPVATTAAKKSPYSFDAETQKVWDDALAAPTMTEARRKLATLELNAANETINNSSIDVLRYQQELKAIQDEWAKTGKDPSQLETADKVKAIRQNIANSNSALQKSIQERNKVFKEYASGEVKDPSIVSEGIREAPKGGGLVYVTVRRNTDGTLVATGSFVQPDGAGGVKKTSAEVPVTINPDGTAQPATGAAPQSARGTSAAPAGSAGSAPAAFPSSADDTEDDFSGSTGGSSSGGSSGGKWIDVPTGEVGPGMVPITKKVWQPGGPAAPANLVHYIDDKTGTMYWFDPKTGNPVSQVAIPRAKEAAKIIKSIEMPDGGVVLYYDDGQKEIIDAPEEVKKQKQEAADAELQYKKSQSNIAEQSIRASQMKQAVQELVASGKYTPEQGALLLGDFSTYFNYVNNAQKAYEDARAVRMAEKEKALDRAQQLQAGYELSSMFFGGNNPQNMARIKDMVSKLPGSESESVGARLFRQQWGTGDTAGPNPLDYNASEKYVQPKYSGIDTQPLIDLMASYGIKQNTASVGATSGAAKPQVPMAVQAATEAQTPIYEEPMSRYIPRAEPYTANVPAALGRFGQ